MRKNIFLKVLFALFLVMAFGLTGCNSGNINCEPDNCSWIYVEPVIDYSLPQFNIEGVWVKEFGSRVISVNNYAHFWKRFSAACPVCRPAIDPPMPVIIFNDAVIFSFNSFDGATMEMAGWNQVTHSFSATVDNYRLTVSGLTGTLPDINGAFLDICWFNGTYILLSRPGDGE